MSSGHTASVLVLVASAGVLALGTGPYSCWDPSVRDFFDGVARGRASRAAGQQN